MKFYVKHFLRWQNVYWKHQFKIWSFYVSWNQWRFNVNFRKTKLFSYLLIANIVWYFLCQKLIKPMTSYGKQLTDLSFEIYIMGLPIKLMMWKSDIEKIFANWTKNNILSCWSFHKFPKTISSILNPFSNPL